MNVFDLDQAMIEEYAAFSRSFTKIRADDIRDQIDVAYATRKYRPEPILQINPHYKRDQSVAQLVRGRVLHEGCDDRPLAELEAESTAFVVCRTLGLDTSGYSFGYVACWAGGGPEAIARIRTSGARIQRAASVILDTFEEAGAGTAAVAPTAA